MLMKVGSRRSSQTRREIAGEEKAKCPAHGARVCDIRRAFFKSKDDDSRTSLGQVSAESLLWLGERRTGRMLTWQVAGTDPSSNKLASIRKGHCEFSKAREKEPNEIKAFREFLGSGALPAVCLWLVAEKFRTCGGSNKIKEDLEYDDERDASDNRRAARLIYDTFCHDSAALYVPLGDDIRSRLDKVLWETADHINIGRNAFLAAQGKCMVELERTLLPEFLEYCHSYCEEECVAVVPHASLSEVIASDESRGIFASFLKHGLDIESSRSSLPGSSASSSSCSHLGVRNQLAARPFRLLAFYEAARNFHDQGTLSQSERLSQGAAIIRNFFSRSSNQVSLCHLVGPDQELGVNLLQENLDFEAAAEKAYFELRDEHFAAFTQTSSYLKCLSILSKVPLDYLHRCIEKLGKPFLSTSQAGDSLASKQRCELEEKHQVHHRSGFGKALRFRKGGHKIGLAPGPSNGEITTQSKVNASPRDWKRAQRLWCCEQHRKAYPRELTNTRIRGNPNQHKRIFLGLEGILRNQGLRRQLMRFIASDLLPERKILLDLALRGDPNKVGKETLLCAFEMHGLDPYHECATDLGSDEDTILHSAATNVMLAKYWAQFRALVLIDQKFFPGVLDALMT